MRNLDDYLEGDRQWPRFMRIAHAQYQRRNAATQEDKSFWRLVLKANGFFPDPEDKIMWPGEQDMWDQLHNWERRQERINKEVGA